MNKIRYIIFCILSCQIISLSAQSGVEILQQMGEAFSQLSNVHLTVDGVITLRGGNHTGREIKAEMIRTENRYYSKFMETIIVVSDSIMLTIDTKSKIIIADKINPVSALTTSLPLNPMQSEMAALESYASRLTLNQDANKGYILSMNNPEAFISQASVFVDKNTYLPYRFEYRYNPTSKNSYERLSVNYRFKTLGNSYRSQKTNLDQYIRKEGGKVTGIGPYATYRILNRLT